MNKIFLFLGLYLTSSYASYAQTQIGIWSVDGNEYESFGRSVSMPDAVTFGAGAAGPLSFYGDLEGIARVFVWDGMDWVQKGSDMEGEEGESLGWSVSMPDINTIATGGTSVRVFAWNGTDWVQKGSSLIATEEGEGFGYSVWMPDAVTIAVGVAKNDNSGTDAGCVRIYKWNGFLWLQKGVDISGMAAGDHFGWSVCMPDTNTVAIGAPFNDGLDGELPDVGQARVYSWNGSTWVKKGSDLIGESTGDSSGYSVNMPDAETIAIGAVKNDDNGPASGHVRVYKWDGSDWVQKGADIAGGSMGDNSGHSVSMPDDHTIAIGSPEYTEEFISQFGRVHIYRWEEGAWTINSEISVYPDALGYSVSMPDSNIIGIGGPLKYLDDYGAVYVYGLCMTNVDDSVMIGDGVLTAHMEDASYQWLDCDNDFAPIAGATNQTYSPLVPGNYAVAVTSQYCTDTSVCNNVVPLTINNVNMGALNVSPNPFNNSVSVTLAQYTYDVRATLTNCLGETVFQKHYNFTTGFHIDSKELLSGLYILQVYYGGILAGSAKLVKN